MLSRKVLATDMILPTILILSFAYVTVCQKTLFKATKIGEGKIQYVGTLENKQHARLLFCFFECQNNVKCLTFFYNVNSKRCILHSKTFHFRDPDKTEDGWKMYLLEDAASRCHYFNNGFLYYRLLDLCYNFNPEIVVNYDGVMIPQCSSYCGELIKIDSQEKQTYISYAMEQAFYKHSINMKMEYYGKIFIRWQGIHELCDIICFEYISNANSKSYLARVVCYVTHTDTGTSPREGRTTDRVAIQGHSFNPWNIWTYDDGTLLGYTNWRVSPPAPKPGQWRMQIFKNDVWTEQNNIRYDDGTCIYICEIK